MIVNNMAHTDINTFNESNDRILKKFDRFSKFDSSTL